MSILHEQYEATLRENASLQQQLSDCKSSLRAVEADIATKDRAIADLTKQLYEADKSDMSARDLLNDLEAKLEAADAREKQARAETIEECAKVAEATKDEPFRQHGNWHGNLRNTIVTAILALAIKEGGK